MSNTPSFGLRILQKLGFPSDDFYYKKHGLHFLNIAQFFGVINDNVFKYLILFLFIDLLGVEKSNDILFWVGIIYVVPFLLFSSAAGIIADRFSKMRMVEFLKVSEIAIMGLGVVAFIYKSELASYGVLFLLSFQSAVFGPPKYSIIPELVDERSVPKANGLITSFTYLAIIIGTFLAAFLTQITNRNFPLTALICVAFAFIGFLASVCIPYTKPSRTKRKINPLFFYEIYKTLQFCKPYPHLLPSIFGAAFFLYVGAFFQLNFIPFAMESMGLSALGGGYLFLTTAIGIAGGAYLAGRLCKEKPELGLSCIGGALLFMQLILLYFFSFSLTITLILLAGIGVAGGLFIVPFESFIQTCSPTKKRGQIVASSNFLSFCGVLLAPISLKLFHGVFKLQANTGFLIVGIITAFFTLFLVINLRKYFAAYIHQIIHPFYTLDITNFPENDTLLIVSDHISMFQLFLLYAKHPTFSFFLHKRRSKIRDPFLKIFLPIKFIYGNKKYQELIDKTLNSKKTKKCLIMPSTYWEDAKKISQAAEIHTLGIKKNGIQKALFSKKEVLITFSKIEKS